MAEGVLCLALLGGCVPYPIYHSREAGSTSRSTSSHPVDEDRPAVMRSSPEAAPAVSPLANAPPLAPGQIDTGKAYQVGFVSYYGDEFHGRRTSSGDTYDMHKLTAAHRVLPLGTRIKVTNLENGRWVEVEVNDRGPHEEERILDLSLAAALELEIVKTGTARVMIEVVEMAD